MRVVLEEIEGTLATLIPDDGSSPIHVHVEQLPNDYEVGSVFDYWQEEGQPHLLLQEEETHNRKSRIRSKREQLLKRTREKKKRY